MYFEETNIQLNNSQVKWNELMKNRCLFRKENFLNARNMKITGDKEVDEKRRKKIIRRAKKEKRKQCGFKCLTNYVGRGRNQSLKPLHAANEANNSVKTFHDRHEIERRTTTYNRKHAKNHTHPKKCHAANKANNIVKTFHDRYEIERRITK